MDELTDPETLRERDDVEFIDAPPEEHQNHFEGYEPIAGMAIVGVTNERNRLLVLEREDAPHPTMPYHEVALGDDWVATAQGAVESATDIEVAIDDVHRVRRNTYRSETGEKTTGYDVVFAASPSDDGETSSDSESDWVPAWHDTTTLDLPDDENIDVVNDIRLFIE